MAIEVGSTRTICPKCGTGYSNKKGNFPVSYGSSYRGAGYIHLCKNCVSDIYEGYMKECRNSKSAMRQVCRKLDLYWSESVYESVAKKNSPHDLVFGYITKLNNVSFAGKCYDDTLAEEGALWKTEVTMLTDKDNVNGIDGVRVHVSDDVIEFWGAGYSPEQYAQLEQRRQYYSSNFPDTFDNAGGSDIGSDVLMRQLCNLEVSISKDAAAGKSIDKSVNSLNNLIGSLNLKPAQKKNEDADSALTNTPMGVWLYRYENKRPLPDVDESLKDVNHIKKYVFTWLGHLCKMLGVKNGYTKMYEEEIARLRVEKPEYEDDDDETLIINSYSSSESGDEQ